MNNPDPLTERSPEDELMITRYMDNYYNRSDPAYRPPTVSPEEYTATYTNPITAPASLSYLNSQFGTSNNLAGLVGSLPDIPSSPPIKVSDFIGKSGNYRLNGLVRLDRWDDLLGAGLSNDAKNTWDGNDSTYMPSSYLADTGGGGWCNTLCSNWALVSRFGQGFGPGKVTNVREFSFSIRWRQAPGGPAASWKMWVQYYENGAFGDLTSPAYGGSSSIVNSINPFTLVLVTGGVIQPPVAAWDTATRWARIKSSIEGGLVTRFGLLLDNGHVPRFADLSILLDCDVTVR